ncbi:ABC transporter ATP-binding protein [Butyrivibrio sp. X503]|uniref:ABC transporter ATP-binding protein n=1 Tax=Butyrivibrio sp. X503 TaxID=2364878 RepID=UPI000EA90C1B|nr:ABC transporter ATP-binding protein [Butyrivibrio sp. X503]RKM54907.1 ABC transporter ATP-binding protein [Butyrivibrio sp. X503]
MPEIILENITKRWGKFFGVDNVSLNIPNNSFITLLGPSGCGKTTILRMIAGLETPTEGKITIGDKVVFDSNAGINVPANKRRVGFLFQNYALWPNMTVYENIAFGLKNINEKMPVVDIEAKQTADMIRALQNGNKVKEIVEECRDKNGKLDENKAYVKLIDNYSLSIFTAKELYGLNIQGAQDVAAAAKSKLSEYEAKLSSIKEKYSKDSKELNDKFEVVKNGVVVEEVRKLSKEEIDSRVRACSRIVKIGMFMDRYPAELSGGQQQRVAIARTLAPEPQVLFMDEPLSNLDAKLRLEMRYELQRLHVETGSTFVYVTHDQMEAMTLATRICLINNGVLQQYAAPLEVYNRPSNLFVADFVGNPSMNFVDGKGSQQADGSVSLDILGGIKARFVPNESLNLDEWRAQRDKEAEDKLELERQRLMKKGAVEKSNKDEVFKYHIQKVEEEDDSIMDEPVITDEDFVIGIRPEAIDIDPNGKLDTTVYGAMPTGMESTLKLRIGEYLLTGVIFGGVIYKIGQEEKISINGNDILLFDRRSGKLICAGKLEM